MSPRRPIPRKKRYQLSTSNYAELARKYSKEHSRPICKPTKVKHQFHLSQWERFVSSCEKNKATLRDQGIHLDVPSRALTTNDTLPGHGVFKSYARFTIETRSGVLDKKNGLMTKKTLRSNMRFIWSALERRTNQEVPKQVRQQVHNFINGELTEEFELQDIEGRKDIASILDLEILLHQLWALDGTLFKHERIRIQMALLLMLVAYTTTRPGTIVESSAHRESNEAVCYKHLLVELLYQQDNEPLVVITVEFVYLKGLRNGPESIKFKLCEVCPQLSNGDEERNTRLFCPIILILALAFADGAFRDVNSPKDLYNYNFGGRERVVLHWKESFAETLVFREWDATNNTISTSQAMKYEQARDILYDLARRAGYRYEFTFYNFRRGSSNKVNAVATSAERKMIMGHRSKNTFRENYLSKSALTDVQSLFLGRKSKAKAFIAACEVLERDVQVPQSLPILEHLALHKNLRKAAFDDYREQWFKEHSTSGIYIPHDPTVVRLPNWMGIYCPERVRVAEALCDPEGKASTADIVDDIVILCKDVRRNFHYPGEEHLTTCSSCSSGVQRDQVQHVHLKHAKPYQVKTYQDQLNKAIDKFNICQWQYCGRVLTGTNTEKCDHILQHLKRQRRCHWSTCTQIFDNTIDLRAHFGQVHGISAYRPCQPKFCFYCAEWYLTDDTWNDHCLYHLNKLPLSSPLKLIRGAVVSPMLCIFCLGDSEKKPSQRFRPFYEQDQWYQHLRHNHVDEQPAETSIVRCPHPACHNVVLKGRVLFWAHAYDVHGVICEVTSCKSAINIRKRPVSANDEEPATKKACATTDDLSLLFERFSATLKKQRDKEAAAAAHKVLGEEAYDLRAICEMKVRDWKEINIQSGLGLQIARFAQAETMDM